MPRADKSPDTDRRKRQAGAVETGRGQKGAARPAAETRAWAAANKLHSPGKKNPSRQKLPSGPLGGSGRKTNLSRSS